MNLLGNKRLLTLHANACDGVDRGYGGALQLAHWSLWSVSVHWGQRLNRLATGGDDSLVTRVGIVDVTVTGHESIM